ncbi:MAG: hypothetical protein E6Q66_03380 [Pedobacter sp.]|nr:MAG: hypothetical protein E6Q66_03380 [Pedobacter sp.]
MLSRGVKCITVIVLFFITACNQQEQYDKERAIKALEISKNVIGGQHAYDQLYQQCLDSLNTWCYAKLPAYESVFFDRTYRLGVLYFNKEKDRMVTAILVQCNEPICEADAVHYFYGAKIKGQWYFFQGGGTMVIPRDFYQKDTHTPVSFEKLHELAVKNILRGYVKKNKDGEWEINDAFFTAHFSGANWGDFDAQLPKDTLSNGKHFTNKREYFENIYLRVAKSIWPPKEDE